MITKDRLEQLQKPVQKNAELNYTIGGEIEASVHSNLESERIAEYNRGHRAMHKAVHEFRQNMAFKSREGLAQSQFNHVSEKPAVEADTTIGVGHDPNKVQKSAEYTTKTSEANSEVIQNFRRAMNDNNRAIER